MDDAMKEICAGAAKELSALITKRAGVPELALRPEDRAAAIRYYDEQIALAARFLAWNTRNGQSRPRADPLGGR